MTNILKPTKICPPPKQKIFSAYFEKMQMQVVLLIILEPTNFFFAETPDSYVDFGGENQRFAGRAGQHYLK